MFLCRDRLGQNPLYYFNDSSRISFSSNLISLKDITNQNQLDESSLFSYLNYGKTEGISTIFKNLYQVDQGEMIVVDLQTALRYEKNYWNLLNFMMINLLMRKNFLSYFLNL